MCEHQYRGVWSAEHQRAYDAVLEQVAQKLREPHVSPFESFDLFELWIAKTIDQTAPPRLVRQALTAMLADSKPTVLQQMSAGYLRSQAGIVESISRMPLWERDSIVRKIMTAFPPVDLRCHEDPNFGEDNDDDSDSRMEYHSLDNVDVDVFNTPLFHYHGAAGPACLGPQH